MKIELSGDFLKGEELKGDEIVTILDEGTVSEITSPEGKTKKVMNFRVKIEDEEKTFTPNKTNLRIFMTAWGDESKNWIGKKFKVKLMEMNVFGKIKKSIHAIPFTKIRDSKHITEEEAEDMVREIEELNHKIETIKI